jgi:hypothetical protein
MRFLIDANMPRSTAELLKGYNHEAVDVRDIGMAAQPTATLRLTRNRISRSTNRSSLARLPSRQKRCVYDTKI